MESEQREGFKEGCGHAHAISGTTAVLHLILGAFHLVDIQVLYTQQKRSNPFLTPLDSLAAVHLETGTSVETTRVNH